MGHTEFCTVLDHSVDGQHTQQTLIDALVAVHERWLRHRQGYESAQFLASGDGHRVLSVVRWKTESDFHAFEASDDHATVMADIQRSFDQLPGLTNTSVSRFQVLRHLGPAAS